MGLDAGVYCDCLETGRIGLPAGISVRVEDDGCPVLMRDGKEIWEDDPQWTDLPCAHDGRRLCHHRLGNIAVIALLRSELKRQAEAFPILLGKVVYNGIHAGDYLLCEIVPKLQLELEQLKTFDCTGNVPAGAPRILSKWLKLGFFNYTSRGESEVFMQEFRRKMVELTNAALRVRKPIHF